MEIDPQDVEQGGKTAEAQVSSAEAQMKLAKNNLLRYGDLYKQQLISKAEYEQYKTASDTSDATLKQARAQYADAQNKPQYCKLASDNAGVVSNLNGEGGSVVALCIPFVISAVFVGMQMTVIPLHKVSLGALIIAEEMMAVKLEQGWERFKAAS